MHNDKNLIKKRKVSREIYMKFMYKNDISGEGWDDLYVKSKSFVLGLEDDIAEVYKSHGGKLVDEVEQDITDLVIDFNYMKELSDSIEDNKDEIDSYINKYARKWTIENMPVVDVSILRVAIAEIKFLEDIPDKVACDEAVNISKIYCDDDAYKYINGILGSIISEEK
ncbi:transcription antitermination factor NusB [Peptostreptococcus faecalis]|uniref:transcription antitermination factor NusB n=1 Tax=Peptostreptococcus faecalis TaxID=2045015 RepID=UPI000C7AFD80|nr:transcription antitermination factor NusB [Peptostreptococcus faecalis]